MRANWMRLMRFMTVAGALMGLLGLFGAGCGTDKPEEPVGQADQEVVCHIGDGNCGFNGNLCSAGAQAGLLICQNNVYTTICQHDYYCDKDNFPHGCIEPGPTPLACNLVLNVLVVDTCGNKLVGPGEQCDKGSANGAPGQPCNSSCHLKSCGNGMLDNGEECDNGATNGLAGDPCSKTCNLVTCGNGVKEQGEQCDSGNSNGALGDPCGLECELVACGNGIIEQGEDCDNGPANGTPGNLCNSACLNVGCGNGIVEVGEQCDSGANNGMVGSNCDSICKFVSCGNGIVDQGEACDEGALNGTFGSLCTPACTLACVDSSWKTCANVVAGDYGCNGAINNYCPNNGLQCLCPNPYDNMKGTYLPAGTDCATVQLCWSPASCADITCPPGFTCSQVGNAFSCDPPGNPGVGNMTYVWSPGASGAVVDGAVQLMGWYNDNGNVHSWGSICNMALQPNGDYMCNFDMPPGSDFVFGHQYANNAAQGGLCWGLDKSPFAPCGGSGTYKGTSSLYVAGNPNQIPMIDDSNLVGPQQAPGPYYWNHTVNPTP